MTSQRMKIIEITFDEHKHILEKFLSDLGEHQQHFRYFSTRPIKTIKNHLITLLILEGSCPVAYGHLEREGNDLWLGVATAYGCTGKGFGGKIVDSLIAHAQRKKEYSISLTVDKDNLRAINLYKKKGFVLLNNFSSYYKFIKFL